MKTITRASRKGHPSQCGLTPRVRHLKVAHVCRRETRRHILQNDSIQLHLWRPCPRTTCLGKTGRSLPISGAVTLSPTESRRQLASFLADQPSEDGKGPRPPQADPLPPHRVLEGQGAAGWLPSPGLHGPGPGGAWKKVGMPLRDKTAHRICGQGEGCLTEWICLRIHELSFPLQDEGEPGKVPPGWPQGDAAHLVCSQRWDMERAQLSVARRFCHGDVLLMLARTAQDT